MAIPIMNIAIKLVDQEATFFKLCLRPIMDKGKTLALPATKEEIIKSTVRPIQFAYIFLSQGIKRVTCFYCEYCGCVHMRLVLGTWLVLQAPPRRHLFPKSRSEILEMLDMVETKINNICGRETSHFYSR